ncbi:MAG: zinc ribbon domain-containing protein [Nitrosopumilus sp.]|nr:zinc ribbon domain-containing protein [Nitrosopumilus sp.]MDA7943032.1 zinc ribbon domain-containing protein [Nitrosopumilus sp.]MDA7953488.1 zinc ribbon domain-containing protein [Nitrosopumilus sp.]MDA7958522.1 zinc ribbon domain-containing protein [Nitrosopumilus sp.]MDA7959925.1 zinc ribbon domain-containing protein [Nitrosopumilus sp.]
MRVFDGKKAAQDYMSTHTLAFSTPELTLMRFAFWLGDSVPDPEGGGKGVPRMMTFMTEQDFEPVLIDDDKYEPSGAVRGTAKSTASTGSTASPGSGKFCHECGGPASAGAKFCPACGTTLD